MFHANCCYNKVNRGPMCLFCLSIRSFTHRSPSSSSRRLSVRCWRRGGSFLPYNRPRLKPLHRRSSRQRYFIAEFLSGFPTNKPKGETLTLEEVLHEIRTVWTPNYAKSPTRPNIVLKMNEKFRKSTGSSTEILGSPIPLRRRLSAPETIMRKHMLAQQRSESQDSESTTQSSDARTCQWREEMEAGSDTNLSRKRDPDLMRKSTLLRRLWSHHTKPVVNNRFSGTFYEWQHSFGKLSSGSKSSTHSLTSSVHSSPEHLVKNQGRRSVNVSPQHKHGGGVRNMSPKRQIYEDRKPNSPKRQVFNGLTTGKATFIDASQNCASFSDINSNNSDSAYTNSKSICSSNNNESSRSRTISSEVHKIKEKPQVSNLDSNRMQLNGNNNTQTKSIGHNSSTQTSSTTNVNVISNVHLSQSTLDLIFNQVLQDLSASPLNDSSPTIPAKSTTPQVDSNVINVQEVPSFYLKRKEDVIVNNPEHSRIVKYMISNIGVGSYKPAEVTQIAIPRFSALPRTVSMEVNISSGDSTDKESDTISLVDSLEDSSRTDGNNTKTDSSPPLPDNSSYKRNPTAFFIPIDQQGDFKAVSDHLPEKLRGKLAKRQQKMIERQSKNKSSSLSDGNYISASDNLVDNLNINLNTRVVECKSKKRINKPILPNIEGYRRIKVDNKNSNSEKKDKCKPHYKSNNNIDSNKTKEKKHWVPKVRSKTELLSPLYSSKNEYVCDYGPKRRIYHKTEFNDSNKRIEILEIMECVETPEKNQTLKAKSKIPVLINQKLPKVNPRLQKPAFLDLETIHQISDPKLDQLIANILIETLNSPEVLVESIIQEKGEKSPRSSPKYQQKFEAIPEELFNPVSMEEAARSSDVKNNNDNKHDTDYKGKAAVAVVRDENFASIPKGWITFYMLHKNRGSPDSTSDEGKKLMMDNNAKCSVKTDVKTLDSHIRNDLSSAFSKTSFDMITKENSLPRSGNGSSSSDIHKNVHLSPFPPTCRGKKQCNLRKPRKNQPNRASHSSQNFGDWSVTVSGTSRGGQIAPDLEMCLKFPETRKNHTPTTNNIETEPADENCDYLPKIKHGTNYKRKITESNDEQFYLRPHLPNILPQKVGNNYRKRSDCSGPTCNAISSRIEPRQTQTSRRRYNLTRPKIDYMSEGSCLFDERYYADILRRFPEILSVTGNAINHERMHRES